MNSRPCVWGENCIHESASASAASRICLLERRIGGREHLGVWVCLVQSFVLWLCWCANICEHNRVGNHQLLEVWIEHFSDTFARFYNIMWEIQDVTAVNMMFLPSARKKNFESRGHSPQFRIWTQQLPARAQAGVTYMICASEVFESMQLSLCLSGYSIICTSLEISHSFSGICGKKKCSKSDVWIIESRFLASPDKT